MKQRLLIIDAHAIIHRAFHALPPLTTSSGQQVNAVYGFLLLLLKALKDIDPSHVVVAFDSPGKTFRHTQFPEYKANRAETPQELKSQFPIVREVVAAAGFPVLACEGFEADDMIGTVCAQLDRSGVETIIVTGDMDLLQLVDADTKVMKMQKGVKDTLLYDEAMVKEKHSLTPKQIIDYKGLRGDTSDNIPGVPGIGEKSAVELLEEFESVEGVFKHIEKITGRKRTALEGKKDVAMLSKELATIAHDAPLKLKLTDASIEKTTPQAFLDAIQKYEFHSLLPTVSALPLWKGKAMVAEAVVEPKKSSDADYQLISDEKELIKILALAKKASITAIDTETDGLNSISDRIVGASFSFRDKTGYYVPCIPSVPAALKTFLEDASIKKTGHNIKFDIEVFRHAGVNVAGYVSDSMLLSYLLNTSSRSHGLDNLAFVEFGYRMQPITELIGTGKKQITMSEVSVEKVSWYAAEDADFALRLYEKYAPLLKKEKLDTLFNDIELPTCLALVPVEENGVAIDVPFLTAMSKRLHARISQLEKKIHTLAGSEFNVASPLQLQKVLFEDLKLPTAKIQKTKTGISTAASELEKLQGLHPIIDAITEYRELAKLTSTYIDALPEMIDARTGRIHTSFNQTIAATGRLSSTDPNLQNIPVRTELGNEIRKAFVASDTNHKIVSLDYSQIELRVVAHISKDKMMIDAFKKGEDIHKRTAAALNGVDIEKVDSHMRRAAKSINFGILYGMGVQGIMRDSGITREEARTFLDKYFDVHAGIKKYMDETKAFVHAHGYVESLFGRKRAFPEIASSNRMLRAGAERAAINMPVQGTAADIMKLAMIAVQKAIDSGDIDAKMILQVHDELVFEIATKKVAKESQKIQKIMEEIVKLSVPLVVDIEVGKNWGDLHKMVY
ncbi:MAG: DNA polymerase I [Candidatus Kerfeldbacteria bacterium]|nr:DNA polymerase I [Candidatus Kerfeldbacteria bacterium]